MPYGNKAVGQHNQQSSDNGLLPNGNKPLPKLMFTWDYWHLSRCIFIENVQDMLTKISLKIKFSKILIHLPGDDELMKSNNIMNILVHIQLSTCIFCQQFNQNLSPCPFHYKLYSFSVHFYLSLWLFYSLWIKGGTNIWDIYLLSRF